MLNVAGGNSGRYCRALRRCSSSGGSGSVYYRTGNYSTLCRDYSYGEPHFSIRRLNDDWKLFGKSDLYLSSVCSFWKNFCRCYRVFLWDVFRGLDYCPCRSGKCVCRDGKAFGTEEGDWMDCNLYCSRENTRESFPIFYCIRLEHTSHNKNKGGEW